ncbi:MAG: DNA primase [Candidatus Eremiobacteraeota bacterium]|nr:DNA primase [Candidatus Eremiobacteraeota bacterium]
MRFDSGVTREIRARTDLAAFVGSYVSLHKRGNDFVGLCPFHSERTPSFHVHPTPDKAFFKCFGCGAGGDVITFAQRIENLSFPDAVRMLAQRAGVELEPEAPGAARARSDRERIYEANAAALAFFEAMLASSRGAGARAYCERRGISAASIEKFRIGYAPDEWSALAGELVRQNIDPAIAVQAGLLKAGERGPYDFYRDRLMIPTFANTGEVIAFGGRALGDAEPKYLNTATTPVYAKGKHVFALNLARRAAAGDRCMIVVEGYLDCIALHQAGFDNAVASLGTSFTEDQAKELAKYADAIFLCFDGDAAGDGAASKAVEIAAAVVEHSGSAVRIVRLPPHSDPDDFVRAHGSGAFRSLLDESLPAIEFRLEREVERVRNGFASRASIARAAEEVIRRMTPAQEWDRWRVWIARRLQVSVDDLRNSRFLANATNFAPRTFLTPSSTRHTSPLGRPSSFEREVLAIFVDEPVLIAEYQDRIPPRAFKDQRIRRLYERLCEQADCLRVTADVFELFEGDAESSALLASAGRYDRSSAVRFAGEHERREQLERVVERLELEEERLRYQELSSRIDEMITAGENISPQMRNEYDTLVAKLKK